MYFEGGKGRNTLDPVSMWQHMIYYIYDIEIKSGYKYISSSVCSQSLQ